MPSRATTIGLLAGWGRFPILVAQALRAAGYRVCCLGVKGHADPGLAKIANDFRWVGLTKMGACIRYFKSHGVGQAIMAGKIHKFEFYRPWVWWVHLPDLRAVRAFYKFFVTPRGDQRDDALLGALVREFARDGISFSPPTDFAPELLVKFGTLTHRTPSAFQLRDVEFGWKLAKELGRLDVGQSVCVKGRSALAVEAIEGTDACIRRAGELCRAGGFCVVKVAKPQQDMRFDVPTIGLGTLRVMLDSGATCLAVEAGKTIILDEPEFIAQANEHRVCVVALDEAAALAGRPDGDQLPDYRAA